MVMSMGEIQSNACYVSGKIRCAALIHCYIYRIEEAEVKKLDSQLSGKDYLLLIMLFSFHKLSSSPSGKLLQPLLNSRRYIS